MEISKEFEENLEERIEYYDDSDYYLEEFEEIQTTQNQELNYTNFVLEASSSSCLYQTNCLHQIDDDIKTLNITRGNINAMLIMPFGTGKTSSLHKNLDSASLKKYVRTAYDITFPGLVGTITKDGEIVKGEAMSCGGKLLLIDECNMLSQQAKNAMLSLLEYPHLYSRNLGYNIKKDVKEGKEYTKIFGKAGEGKINIYSKFSCITTAMTIAKDTPIDLGFFSRFIPIRMVPTQHYLKTLIQGGNPIKFSPKIEKLYFEHSEYLPMSEEITSRFEQINYFKKFIMEKGYESRFIGDMVRLAGYYAYKKRGFEEKKENNKIKNWVYVKKSDYDFVSKFFNNMVNSYIYADLSEIDTYIISKISDGKTIPEMIKEYPDKNVLLTEEQVKEIILNLRKRNYLHI